MKKTVQRIAAFALAFVMIAAMMISGAPAAFAASDIVVTVGPSGCDFTTISAALDYVSGLSRSSGQRAVIEIQPGDYQEQLYIDVENVTLRNASSNPSIALTNKGVGIDSNAVRITHYYGHGYNYYSMGSDYLYSDSVLASNKNKGSASTTNPGAGSATHWNASVIIAADGFIAEDIIFENSFNQYISTKAAADTIVKTSSAKEGSTTRANLAAGSTAVQNKSYVERAAALAIAKNVKEAYFDHCKFVGRQDTLYGGKGATAAFYDCEVYGACDYIFGGMTAVFAKCDLVFNTSEDKNDKGYITAAQQESGRGYLMYNCTVTSTTPGVDTASSYASKPGYLGRPWAKDTSEVIFYMTVIEATCSNWSSQSKSLIYPEGWLSSLGGESKRNGEYGTYEVSGVNNASARASWANVFSSANCADGKAITVENFLGSWKPFAGKDMTITMPDGTTEEGSGSGSEETTPPDSGDVTIPAGSYVHNFTETGKSSNFYTITGNTSTSKGTVSYAGLTLTTALKIESSTNISFTAPEAGKLTLVFVEASPNIKIDGTKTTGSNGVITVDVTAGSHTITKADTMNLFYMVYTSDSVSSGNGDDSASTDETVTATGSLNMSSVTVTKAQGAADPTSVDTSVLSGLQMTVSYSNGNSAVIGLNDLVISNIKSHDTMGKYIDVDYMDPVTGTKVHTYILVTIEEAPDAHNHSYTTTVTQPTCTAQGYTTYSCSCGDSYKSDYVAAKGHSFSDGFCTVCGAEDPNANPGGSGGTEGGGSGGDVVVPSGSYIHNFTDDGFTSDFYTIAGGQVTNGKHGTYTYDFGSGTETLNYAVKFDSGGSVTFTPTADGTVTIAVAAQSAGRTVVINNGSSNILTVSISAANQLFVETVEVSANVTYTVKRSNGESGLFYIAYVPASTGGDGHTHSYTESITTAATCEGKGVKTFTCGCGDSYTEEIPALGHSYSSVVTEPTCTEQGYTTHTCGTCGNSYVDSYVSAKDHSYSKDPNGTVAPTCTESGYDTYVCSCGDYYMEPIAAKGHSYSSVVTAPTCTAQGYTTHTCGTCGNSYVDSYVNAKDHSYSAVVTAPTCTDQGYTTYTCGTCGDSYEDNYVNAKGHSFANGTCTVCGEADPDYSEPDTDLKNGICKAEDGNFYLYVDDVVQESFTGLYANSAANWYIVNGQVQLSYTGLVTVEGERYYVKGGCVNDFTGLKKLEGTWLYFVSGKVDTEYVGLVSHNGQLAFVENGEVNFNKTDLVEYEGQLHYVKYGLWSPGFTGMMKASDGVWRYVANGVFGDTYTGLAKNSVGWWYVQNGLIDTTFTGLVTYGGAQYYVKWGQVMLSSTGVIDIKGTKYYIKGGTWQSGFTGTYTDANGVAWTVTNGIAG